MLECLGLVETCWSQYEHRTGIAAQCHRTFGFMTWLAGPKFQFIPRCRNGHRGPDSTRAIVAERRVLCLVVFLSMLERAW